MGSVSTKNMVAMPLLESWNLTSDMIFAIFVGLVACYVTVSVAKTLQQQRHLPPGPWGLPFVGHVWSLGPRPDYYFTKISETFGKVFSVRLRSMLVVVMSDPAVVRDAFVKQGHATSGRMQRTFSRLAYGKDEDWRIITAFGPKWKLIRRLVSPALRNVGPAGSKMESIIQEECGHLHKIFEEYTGQEEGHDISDPVIKAVANVTVSLISGTRFEYKDQTFCEILDAVHVIMNPPIETKFPFWLFLFYTEKARPLRNALATARRHMKDIVSLTRQQEKEKTDIASITEGILAKIKMQENESIGVGAMESKLDAGSVWRINLDLIIAGSDTTANTIRWALLIMAHKQDIQQKVYDEITSVIGVDRKPTLQDKANMPFTHATLLEVLRHRPVGPLGLPHLTTEATRLGGFLIPKGTVLFANIWSMHHDSEYWVQPEIFNPERFLDSTSGVVTKNHVAFMPFGIGPRVCIGEFIANMELFLIFTAIMQRFSFGLPPGVKPTELDDGVFNLTTLNPRPSKLVIRSR